MKRLYFLTLLALVGTLIPVQAVKHYSCDFESQAARDRWVLNPTANKNIYNQLANKWYIGAPGNNGRTGEYGLYISDDGGQTAHYTNTGCWVFACDSLTLQTPANGSYSLTFDYCAMGNVNSGKEGEKVTIPDGLYLLWIPVTDPATGDSVKVRSISTSSGSIPAAYENYVVRLQPTAKMDHLGGNSTWHQCEVKIDGSKCDGTPHYLAFVWTNGSMLAQQPGAMIDNIEIRDEQPCDAPTNLEVTPSGTTVLLSWSGTASEYEVSAYCYETNSWSGPKLVTGTQTSLTGLPVGQTDFIVRAKCSDDEYSLKTIVSKLIYYPDQMCVDYLNLDNAVCYVNNSSPDNTLTFNDFKVQKVDKGPEKMESRHTVHFDRTETEPRTGGLAKTIPDGELASIRLGNWDSNDEAERIEFTFEVDTIKYPVLLLKYMPLLEAPGHDDHENPRFKLDMLINGVSIGRCGMADFNANDVMNGNNLKPEAAAQGWHVTRSEVAGTSDDVVWKEWTTVGVNLRKPAYEGKQLTVRLTTHDCTFSAHSGYAYFTLGCSDGKLKGMKCGEINPTFVAPDGFEYRWIYAYNERYRRSDGSVPEQYVLGRNQEYNAGMLDDSLYVVDCMFVQDSTCFFSLYASTLATNPVSQMNKPKIMMNCKEEKYTVQFDASPSWVQEIDHVIGDTLVSKNYHIESYEWNVEGIAGGWSDEVSPTFRFPSDGGDFKVTLRTTCGSCEDVLHYNLHLDPLGATRDTVTMILCDDVRKAGYLWPENNQTYHNYGIDSIVLFNEATSCDSIIYLRLLEPYRIFEDTMIMPESLPMEYHGRIYPVGTKSLVDTVPSPTSCDTTYVLNLEVYESLRATIEDSAFVLCEGDVMITLNYNITRGRSLRYSYAFDGSSMPVLPPVSEVQKTGHYQVDVPLSPDIYPNVYRGYLLLEDSLPECNIKFPLVLTMQYASSVITQRWNDVLAIRNSDFNGGYEFDSVQWYIGDTPIVGATDFNYYTGTETQLRFGEPYSALLLRRDGVRLFTCPFIPTPAAADVTDMPTLVPPSSPLSIRGKGTATWYDLLGHPHNAAAYDDSEITTPETAGYYLLVLLSPTGRTIQPMMVR